MIVIQSQKQRQKAFKNALSIRGDHWTAKSVIVPSKKHQTTLMPGFTHLQHAQPITYAHYLMAYWQMFKRDYERFLFNQKHTDICP